jgi:hypothetical protein
MKIEMYANRELEKSEIEALWEQKVNMDDWDYMLVVSTDEMQIDSYGQVHSVYPLERLLSGCCSNEWYSPVRFRGNLVAIGIAYHA